MIYTERKVTIKNDVATIDMPIILFRGDREVEIQFTIIDSKFKFESTKGNVIDKTQATYGQLAVALPDGTDLFTEIVECQNGVVVFNITGEMIDEIHEVGFYSFHIRLYNDDKTSRITLPPVMNGVEIREPMIIEDDVENTDLVGDATVGYSMIQDRGAEEPVFDEDGNYIPTVWGIGDKITAEKLNKIEEGVEASSDNITQETFEECMNNVNGRLNDREVLYYGNLITKEVLSNLTADSYIRGQIDGAVKTNANTSVTEFVPMYENTQYTYGSLYKGYSAFYDKDYNYISGYGFASDDPMPEIFTTPEGTAYGRFTVSTNNAVTINYKIYLRPIMEHNEICETETVIQDTSLIGIDNRFIVPPLEFNHDYLISIFNKILCIGDSLTSGIVNTSGESSGIVAKQYSWPTYLTKLTNCETTNAGQGGASTLTYYNTHMNDDWSGHDCAIIQLGVNDVAKAEEHGITDEITINNLQLIIDKIRSENKNCPIFVSGIVKNKWYGKDNYVAMNELIKTFASGRENEHIYFIDFQTCSWTYEEPYSAGHFSALGYLRLAYEYKKYISYLIYKNRSNFINQQFVGTDEIPFI